MAHALLVQLFAKKASTDPTLCPRLYWRPDW